VQNLGAVGTPRNDDVGPDQVVAGHAEVAGQEAEAAAERRTGQPDAALRSGRDGQVLPAQCRHRFQLVEPRPDGGREGGLVDVCRLQLADVDHDAGVDVRPAFEAVPATSDPQCDVVLTCPRERVEYVLGLLGEDDDQRIVHEELVPAQAGPRVVGVAGTNDPAG
jgi:hypothetical protein